MSSTYYGSPNGELIHTRVYNSYKIITKKTTSISFSLMSTLKNLPASRYVELKRQLLYTQIDTSRRLPGSRDMMVMMLALF